MQKEKDIEIKKEVEQAVNLEKEASDLNEKIRSTSVSLENQKNRVEATAQRLNEAGISMSNLSGESARLSAQMQKLSAQQETAGQAAFAAKKNMEDLAEQEAEAAGAALGKPCPPWKP